MRFVIIVIFFITIIGYSQNQNRLKEEVIGIQEKYDSIWDATRNTIVFTGSSSISMWADLPNRFPRHQIVNSGFGASQASDLLAFSYELILRFNPEKVFIYEGDNDIPANKKPTEIVVTIQKIIKKIRTQNKNTRIILIAAKPSLARWHLKRVYKRLNRKFKRMCRKDPLLQFANVWKPMLKGGKVRQDIFLEDGLHMNQKGYDIWLSTLKPFMD